MSNIQATENASNNANSASSLGSFDKSMTKSVTKTLPKSTTAISVSYNEMSLDSSESENEKDEVERLIDFENDKGFELQKKLIEACYGDLTTVSEKLAIFSDYHSEIKSFFKTSKKFVVKIVEARSIAEVDDISDNLDVQDEFINEIKFAKSQFES